MRNHLDKEDTAKLCLTSQPNAEGTFDNRKFRAGSIQVKQVQLIGLGRYGHIGMHLPDERLA
jgi:hypothetical protein